MSEAPDLPCQFCPRLADYSPIHELDSNAQVFQERLLIYFCSDCRAEYLVYKKSNKLYSTSLYTKINDRVYRWSVLSEGSAQLWLVKEPGTPGISINKGLSMVKSFFPPEGEDVPTLTPENINEKIRTWLVFL
jgi:hypothetical protein